jgi:hypothetical protein
MMSFTESKYNDTKSMMASNNAHMKTLASLSIVRELETEIKVKIEKTDDEIDGLQKFMRDVNLKFNDCQNRLLK